MNMHAQPPSSEPGFDELVADIERMEALMEHWDESQRLVALAYRQALDALQKAAFRKLIAVVKSEQVALGALRKAASDPLVYGVLRNHGLVQASQQERLEQALASVRPMLASHGGNVELVAFVPPDTVEVRFLGNCDGCSASAMTFIGGVKRAIEEHCPEIKHVRQVKGLSGAGAQAGFTSPFIETASWSYALDLENLPEQGIATASVDGQALLFARIGDTVLCFHDACAHLGLPISGGLVSNGRIQCSHHNFQYDLSSGECLTAPEVQLRPVPVRIAGGRIEVRMKA